MSEQDPFEGCSPVEGLEHLGRAIRDKNGVISGSPANFEFLRGYGELSHAEVQALNETSVAALQGEFGTNA